MSALTEAAQKKLFLRTSTRSLYDLQALRVSMGNRIVGNFKAKLGLEPSKKEDTLDKEGKKILDGLRAAYKKITDGVKLMPTKKTFQPDGDGVISNYGEFCLVNNYLMLEKHETSGFAQLEALLEDFPIWNSFLSGVDGIGPQMGAVLVGEINIHDFWKDESGNRCLPTAVGAKKQVCFASTIWKYAGLAVEKDGLGQSRQAQHLVDRNYLDKKGKLKTKKSITFNPFLKTKLLGVMGPGFLRMGVKWTPCTDADYEKLPSYMRAIKEKKLNGKLEKNVKCALIITHPLAKIYFDYRWRLENHPKYRDEVPDTDTVEETDPEADHAPEAVEKAAKSKKGHRHRMALRFMVKQFLLQLHTAWRKLEGYPATLAYSQSKLGGGHYGGIEDQKP